MKRLPTVLTSTVLALFLSFTVQAKEVGGVQLQPSITENGTILNLNGAGIRSKFFIDVYVGSLYTPRPESDAKSILDGKETAAVQLNIISGLISSDKMVETVEEGFKEATDGDVAPLRKRIDEFLNVFTRTEIKKGEVFTLVGEPGTGVITYRNGEKVAEVKGDDFRKALFAIWLGDKPADKKLKSKMLGS